MLSLSVVRLAVWLWIEVLDLTRLDVVHGAYNLDALRITDLAQNVASFQDPVRALPDILPRGGIYEVWVR